MSGDVEKPARCEAIADDLSEFALGTLAGLRRFEVLEHVESCQRCRTELDQLSVVVESVQQLAPQVQPPLGFEVRVVEKFRATANPRHRRRRRVASLGAVAAVTLLAFGIGTLVAPEASDRKESAGSEVVRADFRAGEADKGDLFVSNGSPGWVVVTIHDEDEGLRGKVTCNVILAGGQVETVGVFEVTGEYGAWSAPLPTTGGDVRSAQLIDSNGTIVASAQLEV
jgi:Putative zinc-finger